MADLADFEWVKTRAACSLTSVFAKLKLDLQKDVEDRQALLPKDCPFMFKVIVNGNNVVVLLEGTKEPGSITFHLAKAAIEVITINQQTILTATPTFNEKGECRLKVKEYEYEPWYFRKLALEKLFFETF